MVFCAVNIAVDSLGMGKRKMSISLRVLVRIQEIKAPLGSEDCALLLLQDQVAFVVQVVAAVWTCTALTSAACYTVLSAATNTSAGGKGDH